MTTEITKSNQELALADTVQTTILVDRSSSMSGIWFSTLKAMSDLEKELEGNLLSIRMFNDGDKMVKDFTSPTKDLTDISPANMTNIYKSLNKAIEHSRKSAEVTPELKVHHVFVVITDGYSNRHSMEEYEECQRRIQAIDVDATFFVLDSTGNGDAMKDMGFQSVGFTNTPESIKTAIEKVKDTISQMNLNVYLKLNPRTDLALPPAR